MQWQNYKHIGLLQTYTITSAFGSVYPFTIQATNGSFRFPLQTSFKMYWGFGGDLTMVLYNQTYALPGTSLVRGSAAYAYQNVSSLEAMLFLNGTLTAPLDEGLALVRSALGPFGSMDLQYVAMPASVQALLRSTFLFIATARVASTELQAAFDAVPGYMASPVPPSWLAADFYALGGSPLCPSAIRNSGARIDLGLAEMFVSHSQCHKTSVSSMLEPSATHVLVASALLPREINWTKVCEVDPQVVTACVQATTAAFSFWSLATSAPSTSEGLEAVIADITTLHIQLFQFGATTPTTPMALYTYDLFDARDPIYHYYAWLYMYDWLLGKREVVRFTGDHGSMTLLSGRIVYAISSIATNEFPTNFATYAQAANDYVTLVDISLAGCTWMYIAISRGRVEGRNMLSLHSVGSVVWIGRPLLLLRSLTAISILSTATLRLTSLGPFAVFVSDTPPWYTTILAASEVTWLGAIVVDMGLPLTRELTRHFTLLNNLLVWTIAAALSFTSPNTHTLRQPEPACVLAQVDWQVVCVAGDIAIGHRSRLLLLIAVVVVSHLMCFLVARIWLRQSRLSRVHSHFLSSGAIFLFAHAHWQRHGVLYMDRASAVFTGLLSLRFRGRLWVFDVKTWRVFHLPSAAGTESDAAIAMALPLIE
ncbi:hypothetical protein SPRG_13347 [Saprolegnia parasitica CBS 223.65]|uniref:Uncharacterized protein n=1 Tax=Saprolegnia parasitica (strain CBS 223.65) TaxID=695850 RepID=A0A067BTF0_SAPPC|nr:hypothetical protein SPRG_13347 [Saprolegnia parasitica CBS 223.65]KDO21538.1 hypothetical protein SPRG_13347 [Saprolegnia parasitica CBS 223.65]|eukprot:XP_012207717.1 hypothetical protein SPRG_13347 [Saprolegnia parasitica CBS 223.65]